MPEKIYVLWGDKNKKFGADEKLGTKNENVWD